MRRSVVFAAAVAIGVLPTTAAAQFGRIKSRITGAVQPQAQAQATQIVVVPITEDVVTRYLKAVAVRDQAIQNLARENSDAGRYFAAVMRRDSLIRRENDFRAETGPDWERYKQLEASMQAGDTAAIGAMSRLQRAIDPSQVSIPPTDWNAQKAGNAKLDSTMKVAGGFSDGEWGYVNDQIPRVLAQMTNTGAAEDTAVARIAQSYTITPDEVRAIRARRIELARALRYPYRTDQQIAFANNPARESTGQNGAPATNTYAGCLAHELEPFQRESERRKTEFETAQKNGDTQKLMEFAQRFMVAQQAAAQKCAPLLNQGQ